jgi:hypothetical protein
MFWSNNAVGVIMNCGVCAQLSCAVSENPAFLNAVAAE